MKKIIFLLVISICVTSNKAIVNACNENGRTDMHNTNPRTQTVYISHEVLEDYARQHNTAAVSFTTLAGTIIGGLFGGLAGAGAGAGAGGALGTLLTSTIKTKGQTWLEESNMHGKCGVKLHYREKKNKGVWPDWTYTGFDPQ